MHDDGLMKDVVYRRAAKSDVAAMAQIRAANSGTEERWTARIAGYMDCTLHPQKALMPRVVYVAVSDNSIVGLIAGHLTRRYECDGELEWIDVAPDLRRGGVAGELLVRLAGWFGEQKARRVCVDVEPGNSVARAFYGKYGAVELNPHWMVWEDIAVIRSEGR